MPHVTLEVGLKKNEIKQIKGKNNREPNENYQEATKQMIKDLIGQGYVVTGDGENADMLKYDNKYYFDDDPVWQEIFANKILPRQKKALDDIKARIVTV